VEINLYEMFCTDTLRHRESARKVVERIPKEINTVTVNFERIDFVSRSFLHELLWGLCNRKIDFSNVNEEIEQMMTIIKKRSVCVHC